MTAAGRREQVLEPLPARLLRTPLDFILADHHRQRVLCHLCDRLADEPRFDARLAAGVADHIETQLARHIADEEQDLFPLLRRRAKPEDEIADVLDHLAGEHAEDEALADKIVAGLRRMLGKPGKPMTKSLAKALKAFADNERRHLAIENAIVFPLARVRLSARDLDGLAERMAGRRGVTLEAGGEGR